MNAAAAPEAVSYPAADLDRRFYAFALDRLIAWLLFGAAAYLGWRVGFHQGRTLVGVAIIVATVLVVSLAYAVVLGLAGLSPGKALVGLRVVRQSDGRPPGLGPALLRTVTLGALTLPTAGLGLATLAWTALSDRSGRRRGLHDTWSHTAVVDVRPAPAEAEEAEAKPRQIVNLTAMRLMPAPAPAPAPAPQKSASPPAPAPAPGLPPMAPAARASAAPPPPPFRPAPPTVAPPPAPPARPEPAPAASRSASSSTPPTASVALRAASPPPSAPTSPPPGSRPPASAPASAPTSRPPASPLSQPVASSGSSAPGGGRRPGESATTPSSVPTSWRVSFDTGESLLVEGLALVGRRPEARPGEPVRHLIPLRSTDMSLSKTHAQFQVVPDGALVIMDRGSTNGSSILRSGVPKPLTAGRPAALLDGDVVQLGDRTMTVARVD